LGKRELSLENSACNVNKRRAEDAGIKHIKWTAYILENTRERERLIY
jgi:hypothetical protein